MRMVSLLSNRCQAFAGGVGIGVESSQADRRQIGKRPGSPVLTKKPGNARLFFARPGALTQVRVN